MTISYYSYIHSIIITTILITFICLIRSKYRFTHTIEVHLFVLLYVICFVRMFFPFDFSVTSEIPLHGIYSVFFRQVIYKKFVILGFKISPITILIMGVLCVSCYKIIQFIINYVHITRILGLYNHYDSVPVEKVNTHILKVYKKIPKCEIIQVNFINIPLVVGFIHKRILLPTSKFSDSELYYILLHEYMHILKHDLLKKLFIEICGCILWWIPFVHFAKDDIDQLIEIKCDSSIVRNLSNKEKLNYMQTLLEVVKRGAKNHNMKLVGHLGFAFVENAHPMIERFKLMSSDSTAKKVKSDVLILLVGVLFIVCSYLVAPVPSFEPNINDIQNSGYTYVTSENTYLTEENGEYYFITNNNTKSKISEEHVKIMQKEGIKFK